MAIEKFESQASPLAVLTAGSTAGSEIPVLSPVARIGQGAQNDIVLDDDTVSTNHARLEYSGGGWQLIDLESKNGTFVNGVRLAPGIAVPVVEDARLAFGLYQAGFQTRQGVDPERARQSAAPPVAPKKLADRAGFRLPLWLMLLVLLAVAIAVGIYVSTDRVPETDPTTEPIAAFLMVLQLDVAA